MALQEAANRGLLIGVGEGQELDHLLVADAFEAAAGGAALAALVENVGHATRHAGGEVAAGLADDDDATAGHVLAAVIADAFDDGVRARVADAEALAGDAADVGLAGCGAVEGDVTCDHVLLRDERGVAVGEDADLAARKTLAQVIVGVALEGQGDAVRDERPETLPGRAPEVEVDRVLRQARPAVAARDLRAERRADGAVHVADCQVRLDSLAALQRRLAQRDQRGGVERLLDLVLLPDLARPQGRLGNLGLVEDPAEVQVVGLPVVDRAAHLEPLGVADHFLEGPEAELGHVLADFLGHVVHEVDDRLRIAREAGAKDRILRGDSDRAGVQVAGSHHHATERDQGRRGEAELLRAEEGADDHVAAGLHLAVHLDGDARPQVVHQQDLVRLGDPQFPRQTGVLDRRHGRGAGAAVVAADQDYVRVGFGDTRGNRAHAHLGHQLHGDAGVGIGVLEVVDQLGQVLDGVDAWRPGPS